MWIGEQDSFILGLVIMFFSVQDSPLEISNTVDICETRGTISLIYAERRVWNCYIGYYSS